MKRDEKLMEILEKCQPDEYDGSVELQLDEAHDAIQKYYLGKLPEKKDKFDTSDPVVWGEAYTKIDNAKVDGYNQCRQDMHEAITGGGE